MRDVDLPPDRAAGALVIWDVGQVRERVIRLDRAGCVRYADASGDHNPIHLDERAAQRAGFESVVGHGMWTMGVALGILGPRRLRVARCTFVAPVPIPATGHAEVTVRATVKSDDGDALDVGIEVFHQQACVAKIEVRCDRA